MADIGMFFRWDGEEYFVKLYAIGPVCHVEYSDYHRGFVPV